MDIKAKKMVFLGDSITEGSGVQDKNNLYWKRFEKVYGAEVYGYGIGGTRIARQHTPSLNERSDLYFGLRVEGMEEGADIVVVFGGTNDFGHGDAAMGKMSDRTDDTFYGALHNLYTSLINKYPTALIVVMTPCHCVGDHLYYEGNIRRVGILKDYVNVIKEVAQYHSLPVLDLYSVLGINPSHEKLRELYMPDGLHPNDAAHERIFDRLRHFIETL